MSQIEETMDASGSETSDSEEESMDESQVEETKEVTPEVYLPGKPVEEGERLVCDASAYVMLHQAHTGAPCLSFDIVADALGSARDTFPMTAYLVAGTQAARAHSNNLIVMKMSNLHRTSKEGDDDSDSDSEDENENENEEEKKPLLTFAFMKHLGCVNRIRATPFKNSVLAASWSELGKVHIWNISEPLQALDNPTLLEQYNKETSDNVKPLFSFHGHKIEGYGIDWCQTQPGVLATGDCRKNIHIWQPNEAGAWAIDQRPLVGHSESVEDIQWSPSERNILASCSVDKSVRIWDTRAAPNKACMLTAENAHQSDVNVISWNKTEPFIASGGDDGLLHIWDLRQFKNGAPSVSFKHHVAPVSSLEWHPTEGSMLASAGEDDQVALWDLSVEKDNEDAADKDVKDLPPQLLFIHQGQNDIKELHWHPQLPGVMISTAHTGFNVFKTITV